MFAPIWGKFSRLAASVARPRHLAAAGPNAGSRAPEKRRREAAEAPAGFSCASAPPLCLWRPLGARTCLLALHFAQTTCK